MLLRVVTKIGGVAQGIDETRQRKQRKIRPEYEPDI